ncbi:MAG: hypothetical protein B7X04_02160 [Parcubacteria group bacterium 21-54-25]|nr:MAG: hypothetical protein B7X04_02160 [Parcubacteria group bacterium 21-54-25]HQU07851.1 HIT family protein [Candidatus Paceibacterota bacterium]
MEDTLFAKIIRREIPADVVYEDDETLAFLDIHPNNPGHTLVIPKEPAQNIFDISDEALSAMTRTARKIAPAIMRAVDADGMNLVMNNKKAAGQLVFHAHLHLIPRFADDGLRSWPRKEYAPGEAGAVAEKIRAAQ